MPRITTEKGATGPCPLATERSHTFVQVGGSRQELTQDKGPRRSGPTRRRASLPSFSALRRSLSAFSLSPKRTFAPRDSRSPTDSRLQEPRPFTPAQACEFPKDRLTQPSKDGYALRENSLSSTKSLSPGNRSKPLASAIIRDPRSALIELTCLLQQVEDFDFGPHKSRLMDEAETLFLNGMPSSFATAALLRSAASKLAVAGWHPLAERCEASAKQVWPCVSSALLVQKLDTIAYALAELTWDTRLTQPQKDSLQNGLSSAQHALRTHQSLSVAFVDALAALRVACQSVSEPIIQAQVCLNRRDVKFSEKVKTLEASLSSISDSQPLNTWYRSALTQALDNLRQLEQVQYFLKFCTINQSLRSHVREFERNYLVREFDPVTWFYKQQTKILDEWRQDKPDLGRDSAQTPQPKYFIQGLFSANSTKRKGFFQFPGRRSSQAPQARHQAASHPPLISVIAMRDHSLRDQEELSGLLSPATQRYFLAKQIRIEQLASRQLEEAHPVATVIKALRELSQAVEPQITVLNDNPTGRAFESALALKIVAHMPESARTTWKSLCGALAEALLRPTSEFCANKMMDDIAEAIAAIKSRPWLPLCPDFDKFQTELAKSRAGGANPIKRCIVNFLRQQELCGIDVIARVAVIQYILAVTVGTLGQKKSSKFYEKLILPGRCRELVYNCGKIDFSRKRVAEEDFLAEATFGIYAANQRPLRTSTKLMRSHKPGHLVRLNLDFPLEAERVRSGYIGITGISGTGNMFANLLNYFEKQRVLEVNARDVLLGLATYAVFDGGHSFAEVIWSFDHAVDKKYASLRPGVAPQSYRQLQLLFSDNSQMQEIFSSALARLRAHEHALT